VKAVRATIRASFPAALAFSVLLGIWTHSAVADSPSGLGQVFHELAGAPGELEPQGDPFADGDVVRSVNVPAVLRLHNGHVLRLDANSSVWLEELAPGVVQVTVLSGWVRAVGEFGRVHSVGRGSVFRRSPTRADARETERLLSETALDGASRRREIESD
jgi:hypothetical protein